MRVRARREAVHGSGFRRNEHCQKLCITMIGWRGQGEGESEGLDTTSQKPINARSGPAVDPSPGLAVVAGALDASGFGFLDASGFGFGVVFGAVSVLT